MRPAQLAGADVLIAGTPCQSFSVIGKRESLSDDRGQLALDYADLWRDSDARVCVWENVPGVLHAKDDAFASMLARPYNRTGDVGGGLVINCLPTKTRFADGQDEIVTRPAEMPRRLTPLECERLQGFADGYTAMPGLSDTARYAALGDTMAVPVIRWIWGAGEWAGARWAARWGGGLGCRAVAFAETDEARRALLMERWGARPPRD